MSEDGFRLGSVSELREEFGLVAGNRDPIALNSERVPEALRDLIPLAELWGISDDLIRADLVEKSSPDAVKELQRLISRYEDDLDDWLAGPESYDEDPSPEYVAFSAMRMAADFA